jgi:putative hydrolase of HD superfamily
LKAIVNLLEKFFRAASMQRWNDQIRPVDLRELDKQAHKMITAFVLGGPRCARRGRSAPDWIRLIEGGLFEFLQRVALTDLKPGLFERIREERDTFSRLQEWTFDLVRHDLEAVSAGLSIRYRDWFRETANSCERDLLHAAHVYATRWEFRILEQAVPPGFDSPELRNSLESRWMEIVRREGQDPLPAGSARAAFVDLCGRLRFQVRWSHLSIVPRVSVLGHMLIVAMTAYLLSLRLNACPARLFNNYFTGLFHDLPEVLTRDVIDPVKRSVEGLPALIKQYEKREMDEQVFKRLPAEWHADLRLFTEDEFSDTVLIDGRRTNPSPGDINRLYNRDEFSPRDGSLVKTCDHLAAFFETQLALENGSRNRDILRARRKLLESYRGKIMEGIEVGNLFAAAAGRWEEGTD